MLVASGSHAAQIEEHKADDQLTQMASMFGELHSRLCERGFQHDDSAASCSAAAMVFDKLVNVHGRIRSSIHKCIMFIRLASNVRLPTSISDALDGFQMALSGSPEHHDFMTIAIAIEDIHQELSGMDDPQPLRYGTNWQVALSTDAMPPAEDCTRFNLTDIHPP